MVPSRYTQAVQSMHNMRQANTGKRNQLRLDRESIQRLTLSSATGVSRPKQEREKEMTMHNEVTLTGTLKAFGEKSIKKNDYGTMVVGWMNVRETSRMSNGDAERTKYVVGMNIKATDPAVVQELIALDQARQGNAESQTITVQGRLTSYIINSKDKSQKDTFITQIEVYNVDINND